MKEDVQLVCPISFEDKDNIWSSIENFIIDRLPLKDVTWKNPVSSSFINIEKLPLRFLSSSAKLFNETQHPYRRFLAPYVHMYLFSAESMDAYKANKSFVKKWLEPINNIKLGKHPWVIVYIPKGTTTTEVYQKIFAKLGSDFYGDKIGDHSVMLTIPPYSDGKQRVTTVVAERVAQQSSNQQAFAALADLLGKLRDGVIVSFLTRCALYESDIKRLEVYKGTTQFDFWQLFLVKESFALMYQMMQMPERSLALYEELEILLVSAPLQSLPVNDWPLVIDPNSSQMSTTTTTPAYNNNHTPSKVPTKPASHSSSSISSSKDTASAHSAAPPECAMFADSDESGGGPQSTGEISTSTPIKTKSRGGSDSIKGDLLSDSYRIGEDVLFYSINQARMSILWNKFSLFQLQHYIFVRQMYFLLVHLRQPIRCAEKALSYILSSSISIEKNLALKYGNMISIVNSNLLTNESDNLKPDSGKHESLRLYELRKMQASTWIIVASLKLIRECRALTRLMVGDANAASNITSNSFSLPSSMNLNYSDSIEDNLAAISNTSTHGNSIVYLSIAELSRSQHGIRYSPHHGKKQQGLIATGNSSSSLESSPAAILREALFSPQLEIETALKESSKVLTELLEFALKKLHNISSNFSIKQIEQQAIELTLSVTTFNLIDSIEESVIHNSVLLEDSSFSGSNGGSVRRTVTKINNSTQSNNLSLGGGGGKVSNILPVVSNMKSKWSSANEDVVSNLEQELDLLEDPLLEVGDRMDQLIVSLSNKIRSTSHYWSKLHEVANLSSETPIKLNDESLSTEDPSSSGSNKLKNKPATLSKSQIQRGHLLEFCLFTLGSIVQWHFNLIAGRTRFAVNYIIRCADLLICHDFYHLATKRLEYILQSGLIAPSSAYINKNSYRKQNDLKHCHHHVTDNSLQSMHGAWLDIWHWTLRKLLYCAQRNHSIEHYRIIAANILTPAMYNKSSRLRPLDILTSLLNEVVYLSTGRLNQPRTITRTTTTNSSNTSIHPCVSILRLPLLNYFDFSIKCIQPYVAIPVDLENSCGSRNDCFDTTESYSTIKGYRVINDDLYPSTIFQCIAGSSFTYKLDLRINSKLPNDIIVDQIVVIYKLMNPASFSPFRNTVVNHSVSMDNAAILLDSLSVASDEIAACLPDKCCLQALDDNNNIVIKPGEGLYSLTFKPDTIGDFVINRIIIVIGTLHFEAHLIPTNNMNSTTNSCIAKNLFNVESSADDETADNEHRLTLNLNNTEGTKFTSMLRYYFLRYTGIQVISPVNMLKMQISMPPRFYVDMLDDIYLIISTDSTKDEFKSLEISLHDQIYSEVVDNNPDSTSSFITEELASPVIRRKKMNQDNKHHSYTNDKCCDDDEDIAMANAADALAKLLQQNDIDNMNNKYYDKYDKSLRSFCLEIQDSKDWKASQNNKADTSEEFSINMINQSTNSVTFEHISKAKNVFIRIPVKVLKSDSNKDHSITHGEFKVVVDIHGTLLREHCSIPIKYSKEIAILVGPSIHIEVDSVVEAMLPKSQNNLPVILMQSYLRNISNDPIEIIGYNISNNYYNNNIDLLSSKDCNVHPQLFKILEGPKDLDIISSASHIEEDVTTTTITTTTTTHNQKKILLHSNEEYLVGFMLELLSESYTFNPSEFILEFQYQRLKHHSEQDSSSITASSDIASLHDDSLDTNTTTMIRTTCCIPTELRIYRIFALTCKFHYSSSMSCSLLKQQEIIARSHSDDNDIVQGTSSILDYNQIKHHLSIRSNTITKINKDIYMSNKIFEDSIICNSTIPSVVLGNILQCEYVLDIYYLKENIKDLNDNYYNNYNNSNSNSNISAEFSVQLCESKGWIPVGQSSYRSLLHLNTDNNNNNNNNHNNNNNNNNNNVTGVAAVFSSNEQQQQQQQQQQLVFQLHILPTCVGIYPLPPLYVEYHTSSGSFSTTNTSNKSSFTIYPNISTGIKVVMIIPVNTTNINDDNTNKLSISSRQQQHQQGDIYIDSNNNINNEIQRTICIGL